MKNKVNKVMIYSALIITLLTCLLFINNFYSYNESIEALAITLLTVAFHLDSRLIIGAIISKFKNKINYNSKYYKTRKLENKIYKILKVKKWKSKVGTFDTDEFNLEKNTMEDILINMCNSEKIHTINIFISYIPLSFIIWFGQPYAFIVTSIFASLYDLLFVMVQRYNRPRIEKIIHRF